MNNHSNRIIHYIIAIITVFVSVAFDQWTKYLAILNLKDNEPFPIIENIFELRYLENRGAAFGLLQDQRIFFYISMLVITVGVIYFYAKVPMNKRFLPIRLCSVFILAGGIGNCIDRIRFNYVVDFFYFKLIDFPIFNVADIYVTVSVFILLFLMFFYYKEDELERVFSSRK